MFKAALTDNQVKCLNDQCGIPCLTCENYTTCRSCKKYAELDTGACNCIDNFTFDSIHCVQGKKDPFCQFIAYFFTFQTKKSKLISVLSPILNANPLISLPICLVTIHRTTEKQPKVKYSMNHFLVLDQGFQEEPHQRYHLPADGPYPTQFLVPEQPYTKAGPSSNEPRGSPAQPPKEGKTTTTIPVPQ